jgi:hypothetical protein
MNESMLGGVLVIAIIVFLFIYMLPYLVANNRDHNDQLAIGIFNLFFGWTGLFWLLALVWSCTGNTLKKQV